MQCSRWKLPGWHVTTVHHLIDLCVLTDTLVIDGDGIYDPRQLNHRLLLVSEFRIGFAAATGVGGAAAKDFTQRGVDQSADRLRAQRDQRDREDAGSAGAAGDRGSLLTVPVPWQCRPGVALVSAGKSSAM